MIKKDKDKLLTVNRFNRPKFAQGVDRVNNNIFDGTGSSFIDQKIVDDWLDEWMKNNGFITNKTFASPQSPVQVPIGIQNYWENVPSPPKAWNYYNGNTFRPYSQDILNNPTATISPDKIGNVLGNLPSIIRGGGEYVANAGKPLGLQGMSVLPNIDAKTAADNIVSNNPLTKDMIKGGTTPVKKPGFNWKAAAPAIGSGVGMIGNHVISDGFNTTEGAAIANVGNMIGQAVGQANPILGGIISAGSGILGGVWNRGFGVKKNEKNIAAIKGNTAAAKSVGNELAQAKDNQSVINAASNMVSGINLRNSDIAKNGWFNSKGDKIANDLKNKQANAIAGQNYSLAMGANNADRTLDEIAQYNTIAFGGPLDSMMYNNGNMGAIEYGFLSDYLTNKNKQADMKNKMPGMTGMPNNMFALGGDKKIVASPSSVRVQKYPTNKQIKRKFTQDDYIHAGVYPSKNGGYHILNSDYKEIPISNEEAYRRVAEHAPIQDKAKARNAWQDMFGPWYTEYALGGDVQTHGADYSIGQVYDVTEEEANRLKALGYEYRVIN